jgi:lipopolysaccharide/colanic/teichoic acid biosynthesis glycosyltransferase
MSVAQNSGIPERRALSKGFWRVGGKRLFDVTVVITILPLWGLVFLVLTLAVLLISGTPVLFRQQRVGLKGRVFRILKFRTMHADAPPPKDAIFNSWTYRDDPRVTPFGRHLRRWRLDEVPQFFNVLVGDMSLVGPRPETPEVVAGLSMIISDYSRRHLVRPGLTGLCQVSTAYTRFANAEEILAKVTLDLEYVDRCSPILDLRILGRTATVLLAGIGVV